MFDRLIPRMFPLKVRIMSLPEAAAKIITTCQFCGGGDPSCPVCAFPGDPDPYGTNPK